MALKAMALGIPTEDYTTDSAKTFLPNGYPIIDFSEDDFKDLLSRGRVTYPAPQEAFLNAYFYASCNGIIEPIRYMGFNTFQVLPHYRAFCTKNPQSMVTQGMHGLQLPNGNRIIPKNLEQWILVDAMMDPNIQLVTVQGKAGTGKTFMATAAALVQVCSAHTPYRKLYISRSLVQIGKDLGALPGDLDEKMAPYIRPYYDNLEVMFGSKHHTINTEPPKKQPHPAHGKSNGKPHASMPAKPYQWLFDRGLLEIEALCYIRGRSMPRSLMILDETQNITQKDAKTYITRMGADSKMIMIGDPSQIDSPYLDKNSNGLVYTAERLRNQAITAHLVLTDCVRSPLSALAADLL